MGSFKLKNEPIIFGEDGSSRTIFNRVEKKKLISKNPKSILLFFILFFGNFGFF